MSTSARRDTNGEELIEAVKRRDIDSVSAILKRDKELSGVDTAASGAGVVSSESLRISGENLGQALILAAEIDDKMYLEAILKADVADEISGKDLCDAVKKAAECHRDSLFGKLFDHKNVSLYELNSLSSVFSELDEYLPRWREKPIEDLLKSGEEKNINKVKMLLDTAGTQAISQEFISQRLKEVKDESIKDVLKSKQGWLQYMWRIFCESRPPQDVLLSAKKAGSNAAAAGMEEGARVKGKTGGTPVKRSKASIVKR